MGQFLKIESMGIWNMGLFFKIQKMGKCNMGPLLKNWTHITILKYGLKKNLWTKAIHRVYMKEKLTWRVR